MKPFFPRSLGRCREPGWAGSSVTAPACCNGSERNSRPVQDLYTIAAKTSHGDAQKLLVMSPVTQVEGGGLLLPISSPAQQSER